MIFLGIFLIGNNLDLNSIRIRRDKLRRKEISIRHGKIRDIFENIERLIQKSNIRIYVSYSVLTHISLCFVMFVMGAKYINKYVNIIVAIIFGFGMSTIPFLILRIIADIFTYRIKRNSVDFLIILKNFFISSKSKDIFECFERASNYVTEPFKTYIDILLYEHKNKINPVQCLDNFNEKIEVPELKIFIKNLKICYIHGGDIINLIEVSIDEISKQNEDEDEESTEDQILNGGLYTVRPMISGFFSPTSRSPSS